MADVPTPTPELPGPTIAAPAPAEPSVQDTAQCPSGKATLLVVPQTAAVGEIASTDIVLCRPFTGLAGFQLQVIVEGGATAQIVGLKTPDFGLLTHSPVPTSRLRIEAVDLPDLVPVKSERAVLATIQLRGSSPGVIAINLSAEAIDDDLGNPINPQIIAGALTIY